MFLFNTNGNTYFMLTLMTPRRSTTTATQEGSLLQDGGSWDEPLMLPQRKLRDHCEGLRGPPPLPLHHRHWQHNTDSSTRLLTTPHPLGTGFQESGDRWYKGTPASWKPRNISADRSTRVAIDVHNNLKDYFLTPPGQVSFQDAAITRGTLL